jgi:RNA polymerase sigma-70 factor (TIGR02960 family)
VTAERGQGRSRTGDLDAARTGDEQAFARLVEAHRGLVHAHCYRMLGSVQDAEDAVQETFVAAWRGIGSFEGRSAVSTWLYTIATRICIRMGQRRARVLSPDLGPPADPRAPLGESLDESRWLEPYLGDASALGSAASPEARYDQQESVEVAFVAALQHLPATQRAVLILREVLALPAADVAEALDTSVASVNSALQRARSSLAGRLPAESQRTTLRTIGEHRTRRLVERFVDAWQRADVDGIVALLAEDVTFTMPPLPAWFRGRDDTVTFWAERVFATPWRPSPFPGLAQPAVAAYQRQEDGVFRLSTLNILELRPTDRFGTDGAEVVCFRAFLGQGVLSHIGLPGTVQ